ncbi:hypothetical protein niasHT_007040 [Heterodera trifolii]|uniref:Coiled-coil domain-containing protein 132 n=1 Tax=Heterodera trifolii TaxID=157864 RepID=A0ABD2LXE0_9BILA
MGEHNPTTSSASIIPDDSPVDEKDMPATDRAIEKLFDGIDAIYFMENGFKAIAHELEKLSAICSELEIDELERERFKLKRQMQVVSKKMSALIVKNSLSFNRQVENYESVRTNAEHLLRITRRMRSSIEIGKRKCRVLASVLASDYKRRLCLAVKRELALIATLRDSELKARQILQTDDIWPFLTVVVGVIDAARHFQHYSSVKQISLTLLGILRSTECQMDAAFAEQTKLFNLERYALLNTASHFLGNTELVSVKLRRHFEGSLCDASRTAVLDFLTMRTNLEGTTEQSDERTIDNLPFEQLCQHIHLNDFLRILCKIGSSLVEILCIYHTILKFHMDEDKLALKNGQKDDTGGRESENSDQREEQFAEDNFDTNPLVEKGVMQKSLIDNAFDVFECASQNLNCLLANVEMSAIKFDQFIKVVELAERFRAFGRQYFGNPCQLIRHTLMDQSRKYIERYHAEKMEEVKMFLESETFTLCPVPIQFTLFDLPEFFFLKEMQQKQQNDEQTEEETEQNSLSVETFVHGKSIRFSVFRHSSEMDTEIFPYSPEQFDESPRRIADRGRIICKNGEASQCSSSDDGTRNSIEDETLAPSPHNAMPNLCNSALNLLRVIGRFLQMATVLRSSAELSVESIVTLFNCYVHSIFTFFCSDFDAQQQQQMFGTNFVTFRLRQFVQSIEKKMNGPGATESGQDSVENAELSLFGRRSSLCHALDRNDSDKLFLLAERIVGVESVVFLAKQMELLRPFLEALLPKSGGGSNVNLSLDSFYRSLAAVFDLGDASFGCVAAKIIPFQSILKQISANDWTTGEIHSQHSPYVDAIVQECSQFKQKFVRLFPYVHISNELYAAIWSMLLLCIFRILVQGYADVKKCSIEGRALQLLDVEQLCGELEEMTGLRPLPHRPFVENFVKAFYLPFGELQNWMVNHTEYSLSQTSAILNAAAGAAANSSSSVATNSRKATMSRIMANLLDASGIGEGGNSLFQ